MKPSVYSRRVDATRTTVAVQRYLDDLAKVDGDLPDEAIVRDLLSRAVDRLHLLCATLLRRNYPRLTRGPLNIQSEELLDAVVERLMKAMRNVRPATVRAFFALANQHIRWELNDLARRLDNQRMVELQESRLPAPVADSASTSAESPELCRILAAIEALPEAEREVFNLIRIQGMTYPEAAEVIGVSPKTVQRRLARCLILLSARIGDLAPDTGTKSV